MLWPPAQAKAYNVALDIRMFPFSGSWSEKVGHPCSLDPLINSNVLDFRFAKLRL